VDEMGGV